MATSECFQLILINACWPNVIHVEQRILHQRSTPQGNFTILPTEVANLPTETGSGGVLHPPTHPLGAGPVCLIDCFTILCLLILSIFAHYGIEVLLCLVNVNCNVKHIIGVIWVILYEWYAYVFYNKSDFNFGSRMSNGCAEILDFVVFSSKSLIEFSQKACLHSTNKAPKNAQLFKIF